MYVTETHTYDFSDEFNGITRSLIPKKGTLIMDLEATEDNKPLEIERKGTLYKILREGQNETITVELTYSIHYAVEAYADVAHFYWPFFDKRNKSDYEKLDVFIHPPRPTDDVIAFGYDAAEGTAITSKDGTVHFDMGKIRGNTNGDIRVAYDVNLFPNVTVNENKPKRDEIMAAKQALTDERIRFDRNQHIVSTITPFVIGLFTLYLVALFLFGWRIKKRIMIEVKRLYPLPEFVPKGEMSLPATIAYTNGEKFTPETLTASLLDLIRKGNIRKTGDESFILHDIKTEHNHERLLIDWLFYNIGANGRFELIDLKDYLNKRSNRPDYARDFEKWKEAVLEEIEHEELKVNNKKQRATIAVTGISILPFIILCIVYQLFGYMFILLLLLSILLVFSFKFHPRTRKGARIKRDWTEFQHKYIDMKDDEWLELKDDEQKRAFIYGAGIHNKKIKKRNKAMLHRIPAPLQVEVNAFAFIFIAFNMNPYFTSAHRFRGHAMTGGGSAGGGGVGGGGGGSGAF